jgi:dTDP-4-amino-4,6-dideoxygalactose transaminase
MEIMGWKYNMDDIQAALLIQQIDRLDRHRKRREVLEHLYRERLNDVEGLEFMDRPYGSEISGHHLFTALIPKKVSRDEVIREMEDRGIGVAVNYRAIHTLKYFREKFGYHLEDFPNALEIGNRTISLPLYPTLTEEEVELICDTFKDVLLTLS